MSEPRFDDPMCTCDLERNFGYYEDPGGWEVIDAECEVVAICREERFAKMICYVLNKAESRGIHDAPCILHPVWVPHDGET